MDRTGATGRILARLRKEQPERHISGGECSFLQCIGVLIQTNVSLIEEHLKGTLEKYETRFKSALPLMSHNAPVQMKEENDETFKERLDAYYKKVIKALNDHDISKYVNIYLYAVTTVLQFPVYVLMEDENCRLSWFYFPQLFEIEEDGQLKPLNDPTYLTLFIYRNMNVCLPITTPERSDTPPIASGYIGMQTVSLTAESVESIDVPERILQSHENLRHHRERLVTLIDTDLVQACSEMMNQGETNLNNLQFIDALIRSEDAFETFCQVVIHKKRLDILGLLLEELDDDDGTQPDSAERDTFHILLSFSADELKRELETEKLRQWIVTLKEEGCQFTTEQDATEDQIKSEFVARLHNSKKLYRQFCRILLERREVTILKCLGYGELFLSEDTCLHLCKYSAMKELENALLKRLQLVNALYRGCRDDSSAMEERRKKVNLAVIGGSSTGVIGSVLAITGLALSPVTFGVSLGLTIAGAAIGAGAGIVSGSARGFEAVKQIKSINHIKDIQQEISSIEVNVQERLRVVESLFLKQKHEDAEDVNEAPSADLRGFLALGSAFRMTHGFVAMGIAAARIGSTAAAAAAAAIGPLSLAIDIGFLIEAGVNKKRGNKVTTAEQLRETAIVVKMKTRIMDSIWRGSYDEDSSIVDGS